MKDRLVEAAARAMASGPNPSSDTYVLATAAVEAVLRGLREPDEAMLEAAGAEYERDVFGADHLDLRERTKAVLVAAISTVMGEG